MSKKSFPLSLVFSFGLCFLYWIYLYQTTTMSLDADAASYERLGRLLHDQGWIEYFKTGPNREPFYPLLVSISLTIADFTKIHFTKAQAVIQLCFLFATQLLILKLLTLLNVRRWIATLLILYIGFSPALVNASLSLFSEIGTFPFVPALILVLFYASRLKENKNTNLSNSIKLGLTTGLLLIVLTCVKSIFQFVGFGILGLLIISSILDYFKNKSPGTRHSLIFALIAVICLQGFLGWYMSMNKKFNGTYAFTDRGGWMLYGRTYLRTQPMTNKRYLSAIAMTLGDGFCSSVLPRTECDYWNYLSSDAAGSRGNNALIEQNLPRAEIDHRLVNESAQLIKNNLGQYSFFYVVEAFKMFFWESTKIGFVNYPNNLKRIFDVKIFKDGLRFILALLGIVAFLYTLIFLLTSKQIAADNNARCILFLATTTFIIFTIFYALFCILTRYALPVDSLQFVWIGFFLERMLPRKTR